ncbi:unnamed protein product [Staurois parvus]|uniref:Uncharacterized protein n=1 Tax=Staurois parvus TaxID=386267 RepID=A0ABN9H833_9NEOB|nr:unnamed protein product [Staurois parvus]
MGYGGDQDAGMAYEVIRMLVWGMAVIRMGMGYGSDQDAGMGNGSDQDGVWQ